MELFKKRIVDKTGKLRMAVISGAAHAARYKELNPWATEEDIIRYISSQVEAILSKIDKEIL
jgi:hypothetical protein